MEKKLSTIFILMIFLILLLILAVNVSAKFGVVSPYWNNYPLEMYPGQVKEVSFNLPNCPTLSEECEIVDEEVTAMLESEIAELTSGTDYLIPFGTNNVSALLKISIPQSASIGTTYQIKLKFSSAPKGGEGNVQLTTAYDAGFPVVIKSESEITSQIQQEGLPETGTRSVMNLGALIIGIIVFIIILIGAILLIRYLILRKSVAKLGQ